MPIAPARLLSPLDNDTLGIRIPFAAKAALSTSGFLSLHGQAEGQGLATAHTGVTVSPALQLQSNADGAVTLDNGHLRIGPLVTNIAQVWNDNQESLSRPLWRSLDKQVARLPLKPRVAQLWAGAFRPIKVGKSPVSWLVLRPEALGVSQPRLRDGAITLSLGAVGAGAGGGAGCGSPTMRPRRCRPRRSWTRRRRISLSMCRCCCPTIRHRSLRWRR